MPQNVDRITFMESKILELGKKQHERGYQGGSFTPGFIRKETEYGYRAINVALESLIAQELVEKTVTNTFRNGTLVELDVYKITENGLRVLEMVQSGAVAVNGKAPVKADPFTPEPKPARSYSKPWDAPKPRYDAPPQSSNSELEQTVKALENTVRSMAEDIKALHSKLDRLVPKEPAPAPAQEAPAKRKPRKMGDDALQHRLMILKTVGQLLQKHATVLAEDVKDLYFNECAELGITPQGASQFTSFLKRLETEGLLSLKRVGCKNLGIKGQGSRVVVRITAEGQALVMGRQA